jgi:hypothetical protein
MKGNIMKKTTFLKIVFLMIILVVFFIGCQSSSQNDNNDLNDISYPIDNITLNNKIDGVSIGIQEAKVVAGNFGFLYTIANNTSDVINREAYEFTIRGYSKDGLFLFEYNDNYIFNSSELDPGKKDSRTSYEIIHISEKVDEIVVTFDKNLIYPGWR